MPVLTTQDAPVVPPPSAYPEPIHLPVSPHGDPNAARLLAAAYRGLADRLDHAARQVESISADLSGRWHGHGATALRTPTDTMLANLHTLASAYRSAADHLDEYATALHKAQHHHGWSLGKMLAIGAVVTVGVAVVVVTVGAAAPVGTLAAAEVGEAILETEAAAAGATAAETAATTGLSLTTQAMNGLRTLTAVSLPHLTQGAVSSGIDAGFHFATGRGISGRELTEAFLAGTLGSATTTATRSALRSSELYASASPLARGALDTAAMTATLTADSALGQYAGTGHVNPTSLTENALVTAFTGGAATLRHPLDGTGAIAKPVPTGQSIDDLRDNPDLRLHQGPKAPYGHTLSKHVDKDEEWLRQRLVDEPWISHASSFKTRSEAEAAVMSAIRANPQAVAELVSGRVSRIEIKVTLSGPAGITISSTGVASASRVAVVRLRSLGRRVIVTTAFLE